MLMFGYDRDDILNISFAGTGIIYNLASMKEGFIKLHKLLPPNSLGRFTDRDFDIAYANYIMMNDEVFCEFFQIIYNLYIGKDVLIIYSQGEDWAENVLESLLKLIQQRYGYNSVRIDSDEDYIYARNKCNFSFAPGYGLYNLDIDKERFSVMMESYRLSTINDNNKFGELPYDLDGFIVKDDQEII